MKFIWILFFGISVYGSPAIAQKNLPRSTDPDVVIELFAEHPLLVTPTGMAIDEDGRVFVAESHTHFRPQDYVGPKADRILILKDTDGDGEADQKTVFHEGFRHIMDLAFHQDGSLYVATRKDIHRMRDTDGDEKADEVTRIINLETKGDYPHNGISGLAFHLNGRLSFGLGENLGEDYAIVGTDGKKYTGGGEGGSTYQVDADGKNLHRVSTGWWNPFGMCVDAFDRVFGTDNDPGASPPCRLIQVIEGGDYGYEYRYGRTGLHPLISWTGTNPGNLPMIAGTGEAPCAILAYESDALPEKYLGRLLVASWADHRIEHYKITQPKDQGLVTTKREILIEAQNDFRPVDLAIHPDGTVYVTDWVSSSYTLHKKGRVWRIRPKQVSKIKPRRPEDTKEALNSLHRPLREKAAKSLVDGLKITDPIPELLAKFENPRVRSAIMQAIAANEKFDLKGLRDWLKQEPDVRVQQLGVRLIGERLQVDGLRKWYAELQKRAFQGEKIDLDSPKLRKEYQKRLGADFELSVDFSDWKHPPQLSVRAMALLSGVPQLSLTMQSKMDEVVIWEKTKDPLMLHALVLFSVNSRVNVAAAAAFVDPRTTGDGQLVGILTARRLNEVFPPKMREEMLDEILPKWLQSSNEDVRFVAIKWIADEILKKYRPNLVALLDDPKLDYRTFRAVAAAIDRVDGKPPSDHPSPEFLLDRLTAEKATPALLKVALREIDPGFKKLKLDHLTSLISHEEPGVQLEAIRTLAKFPNPDKFENLNEIVRSTDRPVEQRAAALAGIAEGPKSSRNLCHLFASTANGTLRDEALRSLVGTELTDEEKKTLKLGYGEGVQGVLRLTEGSVGKRPDVNNLEGWRKFLEGQADPLAGERVFFGTKVGTCSKCHQIDGRGTAVGPDLTQIARRLESQDDPDEWLLKTILRPSEDMSPEYTPWIIVTKDGKTLTGLPRRKGGSQEAYLGIDGKEFTVKKDDIEFHKESDTSIMPKDLLQNLTDQEIRNLFAFLKQSR